MPAPVSTTTRRATRRRATSSAGIRMSLMAGRDFWLGFFISIARHDQPWLASGRYSEQASVHARLLHNA
ncbi:hypothetical protein RZS08_13450, partial [Arthrospira platensis SPKY1]|nr:hypothetical protein [Arthrospira platensis SPKY1]